MATAQMTDQDVKKKATQNQKALDTAITQIERSYGKGAIMPRDGDLLGPDVVFVVGHMFFFLLETSGSL